MPAVMIPVVIKFFPETKNLSLEEIGALFGDEVALDLTRLPELEQQVVEEQIVRPSDNAPAKDGKLFKGTVEQIEAADA